MLVLNNYYLTHKRDTTKKRIKHGNITYTSQCEACRNLNITVPTLKKYIKIGIYEGELLKYMDIDNNKYKNIQETTNINNNNLTGGNKKLSVLTNDEKINLIEEMYNNKLINNNKV